MAYLDDGTHIANVGSNGGLDVNIQDQTSPTLIVPMNKVSNTSTITAAGVKGAYTIVVDNATGFTTGAFIVIADFANGRYYTGHQVGAISTKTVTLDTPLDFAYASGSQVTNGTHEMAVNGSVTPQIFSLRAGDVTPGVPITIDVTRIIMTLTCTNPVTLTAFGDQVALTNGIVLRRVDGTYNNIFNAKTNKDLAGLAYDFDPYATLNPVQGVDGFACRLTFAGSNKMGVALRVGAGEDLEMIIQDDLTTTITSFDCNVEGHVVVED